MNRSPEMATIRVNNRATMNTRLGITGLLAVTIAWVLVLDTSAAVTVRSEEIRQKRQWIRDNILNSRATPPFSFTFDAKPWSALTSGWQRTQTKAQLAGSRTEHVLTWTNAAPDLRIKCVAVEYGDYPVVEWTVFLKNIGTNLTPILQDIH